MSDQLAVSVERLVDAVLMANAAREASSVDGDFFAAAVKDVYAQEFVQAMAARVSVGALVASRLNPDDPVGAVVGVLSTLYGAALLTELTAAARVIDLLAGVVAERCGGTTGEVLGNLLGGVQYAGGPEGI